MISWFFQIGLDFRDWPCFERKTSLVFMLTKFLGDLWFSYDLYVLVLIFNLVALDFFGLVSSFRGYHDFLSLLWILQFILNFYTLVLIFKDCSGFQHVYLFVFVSLSRFQSIGYDIYGVALDFWILTSSFFGIGCDFRRFAFWSLDFFGLVLIFYIGLYFFSLIFLFMHVFWFLGSG